MTWYSNLTVKLTLASRGLRRGSTVTLGFLARSLSIKLSSEPDSRNNLNLTESTCDTRSTAVREKFRVGTDSSAPSSYAGTSAAEPAG